MVRPIDVLDKTRLFPDTLHYDSRLWPNLSGFSCDSVILLVQALRESFQTLSMAWQEIVDATGVFFLARYYTVQDRIFTTRYFQLQSVKLSILEAYGLSVCSGSMCSASTTSSDQNASDRINAAANKELKRCLRTTIKTAYRQQRQASQALTSAPIPRPAPPTPPKPPLPPRPPVRLESLPEISTSPIVLESIQCTPRSSVPLPAFPTPPLVMNPSPPPTTSPPKELGITERVRARISTGSSFNKVHLLGPLIR